LRLFATTRFASRWRGGKNPRFDLSWIVNVSRHGRPKHFRVTHGNEEYIDFFRQIGRIFPKNMHGNLKRAFYRLDHHDESLWICMNHRSFDHDSRSGFSAHAHGGFA